ncbi:MAG: Gfo/Idh/MocA family oxidoreductase [Acidobacteria bacterium]|nr:Gfo/Idh/MocA family oxidoreductase [Acidobacteriota bacterium]
MLASFFVMAAMAADLRLGIVGTDTSHVIAFTKILNDPSNPEHIPGAKVVALYKGGSPDIESSASRVEGYAKELAEKWHVEVLPEISAMCGKVDAVFLESVDGRKHLPQFRELVKCGKPVFIDKPLASTLADAREIDRLAKQAKVPPTSPSWRRRSRRARSRGVLARWKSITNWTSPGMPCTPSKRCTPSWAPAARK